MSSDGGVNILTPANGFSEYDVARKDVPAGIPYWIVDVSEIPTDREFRNAWEADAELLGEPHGVSIGQEAWAIENQERLQNLEVINDNN